MYLLKHPYHILEIGSDIVDEETILNYLNNDEKLLKELLRNETIIYVDDTPKNKSKSNTKVTKSEQPK